MDVGKRAIISLCLACALVAALSGCAVGASRPSVPLPTPSPTLATTLPAPRFPVRQTHDIAYGPEPSETLDLCQPDGAPALRPGVLLLHEGGWVRGDKSDLIGYCWYLATQGFVAATINYRLAPASIWPSQLIDVQLAVRFLRAHAGEARLDPSRLCAWGRSACAHLAVFLGVLGRIHSGDHTDLLADRSPQVTCVVDEFGYTDLTAHLTTQTQRGFLSALLGGATPQSDPALYLVTPRRSSRWGKRARRC